MSSTKIIFNQYYYDLLTKVRTIAKKHKDHSSTSKKIIDITKENYQTFDKSSDEYIEFFKTSCNDEFWRKLILEILLKFFAITFYAIII